MFTIIIYRYFVIALKITSKERIHFLKPEIKYMKCEVEVKRVERLVSLMLMVSTFVKIKNACLLIQTCISPSTA